MKINDIKFLPKANAFADVYGKATGMPFVGEMMVAAAGQESEPTPDPEPDFKFTEVKVIKTGEDTYTIEATSNIPAPVDNPYVYLDDDPGLDDCEGDYTSAFNAQIIPTVEDPTKWILNENSDYNSFSSGEIEDNCGHVYRATAPWIDNSVETDDNYTYENTITGTWTYEGGDDPEPQQRQYAVTNLIYDPCDASYVSINFVENQLPDVEDVITWTVYHKGILQGNSEYTQWEDCASDEGTEFIADPSNSTLITELNYQSLGVSSDYIGWYNNFASGEMCGVCWDIGEDPEYAVVELNINNEYTYTHQFTACQNCGDEPEYVLQSLTAGADCDEESGEFTPYINAAILSPDSWDDVGMMYSWYHDDGNGNEQSFPNDPDNDDYAMMFDYEELITDQNYQDLGVSSDYIGWYLWYFYKECATLFYAEHAEDTAEYTISFDNGEGGILIGSSDIEVDYPDGCSDACEDNGEVG